MWVALVFVLLLIAILATNRRYRWPYIIFKTFRRDIGGIELLMVLKRCVGRCVKEKITVSKAFASIVKNNPQKIAFYFEDETWTFSQVDEFSKQIANYFMMNGYLKGDTIALLLENSAEYPCIWLGLSKIGVITSLINTNQVKDPLIHSLTTTNCKGIIFGTNFAHAINDISESITSLKLFQIHEKGCDDDHVVLDNCINLRKELKLISCQFPDDKAPEGTCEDPALFIFTSGTTGLPKAARLPHLRCILMAQAARQMGRIRFEDILYTPLPLYHTAGGLMGVGQALFFGTTVAIRKKFSATQYFEDCAKYNATVAQYVGEICRYLLASPKNGPVVHQVRTIIGNGLRPQIWEPFVERFKIRNVVEIYGATEGISNMGNIDNKVGAIGFVPFYLRSIYPAILIKCNEVTGEAIRDRKGRCIKCKADEPGMLIGKINPNMPAFRYDGYTDNKSTEKKVLTNVFRDGDMYLNSGDILVFDEFGYFYFKDRTGDTFRWKGENVSTSEIEGIIGSIVQLNDVAVYGVKIPQNEGNAGMAAIVDTNHVLDWEKIVIAFRQNLPSYAIPIFIRILDLVPVTGTFKLRKTELRSEGYNIENVKDTLYFLHPNHKKYVTLTKELYDDIQTGKLRL